MKKLFCFGLGYTALRLARALRAEGWAVAGTCRTQDKRARLAEAGIEAFVFDRDRPLADPDRALAGTTHLLDSVPPDRPGVAEPIHSPPLHHHEATIRALGLGWIGHLSTTGVYGDRGGAWVDETSPRDPDGARGIIRATLEDRWLALRRDHGLPVHVFRLSGIYGPGRSALDLARAGRLQRIDKPGQVFNRIHVDDTVTTLTASIARPNPGAAYLLADDEPVASHVVNAHACRLLGLEPPPLVPFDRAEMSEMARSFWSSNKRVSNRRIKEELGVALAYPTFRDGLDAQRRSETPPPPPL